MEVYIRKADSRHSHMQSLDLEMHRYERIVRREGGSQREEKDNWIFKMCKHKEKPQTSSGGKRGDVQDGEGRGNSEQYVVYPYMYVKGHNKIPCFVD